MGIEKQIIADNLKKSFEEFCKNLKEAKAFGLSITCSVSDCFIASSLYSNDRSNYINITETIRY